MAETLAATARKVQLVPEKPRHGDELFAELFGALYAESVRLAALFGADDPEDIAQEAFARLHARMGRLSEADAPAYLRAIVCNLSRSRGRRLSVARRPHPLVPAAPPEPDPGDVVAARGDLDRIRTAIQDLPQRQREAVVLHFWQGLSHAETAAAMGVSIGSVKVHLSRAVATIKAKVGRS